MKKYENQDISININTGKGKKKYLVVVLLVVFVAGGIWGKNFFSSNENGSQIITESQLYKVINVSELSTYQCVYNDICVVKDKYDCAYDAVVKAGIDFSKVEIKLQENGDNNKTVIVKIPKVTIIDKTVDIASLDYMFKDSDYNTETVSEEAYKACISDLDKKVNEETEIYSLAQENAENTVKALVKPFLEQDNSVHYDVKIESETKEVE